MASQYDLPYTGNQVEILLGEVTQLKNAMPEKVSDLPNDSGYITAADLPTKTSDLANDSGFITNAPVNAEAARAQAAEALLATIASLQAEITRATGIEGTLQGLIDGIEAKIPLAASGSNQLADKSYVNASIATASATFRGTYTSLVALQAVAADENDYGYVISTDAVGNTIYNRYKYANSTWTFEYAIANPIFDSSQWAAINSAVTAELVAKLSALPDNAALTAALAAKQDVIDDLSSIRSKANSAYQKPSGGIPASDIADGVIPDIADNLTTNDATKVLSAKQGKVLNENLAQLGQEVGDAWKIKSPGRIVNGVWGDFSFYEHIIIPICAGDMLTLVPGSYATYYTLLNNYSTPVAGETPDFATGYSDRVVLATRVELVAPNDAKWLYVLATSDGGSLMPSSIMINGIEIKAEHSTINSIGFLGQRSIALSKKVDELTTEVTTANKRWWVEGVTKYTDVSILFLSPLQQVVAKNGDISPSTNATRYVSIRIPENCDKVVFSGIVTPSSPTTGYAFYDASDNVVSAYAYDRDDSLAAISLKDYVVNIPSGAVTFKTNFVLGFVSGEPVLNENNFYILATKIGGKSLDEHIHEIIVNDSGVPLIEENPGKGIKESGALFDATLAGATCNVFPVAAGERYLISGYSPSDGNANSATAIVGKDEDGNVLFHIKPTKSAGFQDLVLDIPDGCIKIYVFGGTPQLPIVKAYPFNQQNSLIDSVPSIFNRIDYRPIHNNRLKILCFGSSWFMDTWWYLNKLMGETDYDSELHCYYMGHAKMSEWVALFNNDLTPFSGSEASRSASKNIATNGSDWTISQYSAGGSYNAQAYRDDFYADLIAGDWDIIAIQQGAQQGIILSEWEDGLPLVELVKRYCAPRTTIALNATWTFGLNYSGEYFPTISRLAAGKAYFQQMNTRNTKWFISKTGIDNISPNGAMLSLMRADNTLNIAHDMATDGLHPDNGLPILGLCGCFFETFIAPLVGKSFKEIDWLPTSSTQKASVSGNTFQECSASQLATLKNYVRKALGNRFIYYE